MTLLLEILSPSFLLRDALYESVLLGLFLPLVGSHFVLRRMIFLGVALPQVSASGIAFAFLISGALFSAHQHGGLNEKTLAAGGSILFTFAGLAALSWLEHNHRPNREGVIGTAYALCASATVLFLALDPHGEAAMVSLLKGDLLATTSVSLLTTLIIAVSVSALLFTFRRELLLVAFDRDLARVFGMKLRLWDTLLYFAGGMAIACGVTVAGPLVVFGLLVIPALCSQLIAVNMLLFPLWASIIGGLCSFLGFYAAYALDLPLGPAQVAMAVLVLILTGAAVRRRPRLRKQGRPMALGDFQC